jgi:hypothetical protein
VYSSFLGGSRDADGALSATLNDSPTGIAVADGLVVIVGHTDASDLPTTADAYSRTNTGGDTGFALVLAPQRGGASDLVYGTTSAPASSRAVLRGRATSSTWWAAPRTAASPFHAGRLPASLRRRRRGGRGAVLPASNNVAPVLVGSNDLRRANWKTCRRAARWWSTCWRGTSAMPTPARSGASRVTGVDTSNGSWEFTRDGAAAPGPRWRRPAAGSALLLNADALTRRALRARRGLRGRQQHQPSGRGTAPAARPAPWVVCSRERRPQRLQRAGGDGCRRRRAGQRRTSPGTDHLGATEDQALTIAPATLLGNDLDVEGDGFTVTGIGAATGGSVALSSDGEIVFTPRRRTSTASPASNTR